MVYEILVSVSKRVRNTMSEIYIKFLNTRIKVEPMWENHASIPTDQLDQNHTTTSQKAGFNNCFLIFYCG